MGALDQIVRSGKALYVGISNYSASQAEDAIRVLKSMGTRLLIHQPSYSMLNRRVEQGLLDVLKRERVGMIAFCPLSGGLLTDRYLNGIPADSRAVVDPRFLKPADITNERLLKINALNGVAQERGQSLAQMALSWVLCDEAVTSALIGASKPEQVIENVKAVTNTLFSPEELAKINGIVG